MLHKYVERLFFIMFEKFYNDGMKKWAGMKGVISTGYICSGNLYWGRSAARFHNGGTCNIMWKRETV